MDTIYSKNVRILPSRVDAFGRLSAADTFDLFMDTATEAAEAMGVGWGFLMRKGLFWITVKTRVEFLDPPRLLDEVAVVTWPQRPGHTRCERHYELRRGGEVLVRGKTEWAIVSAQTRRPQPLEDVMPEGLEYREEIPCPEPFPQLSEDFPDPPFATHRVQATDIDMAMHMNNVAYVRAIVNAFSVREWRALRPRRMDVIFRASAHEGDTLYLRKRQYGDTLDVMGSLGDGTVIVMARMEGCGE